MNLEPSVASAAGAPSASHVSWARRTSMTSRLVFLAAIGPLALAVVVAVGISGFAQQREASTEVQQYLDLSGDLADVRFEAGPDGVRVRPAVAGRG